MSDLKHYEKQRDKAVELIHIHKALDAALGDDPLVGFILYSGKIVLEFDDLKVLSRLRKAAKSIYPKWTDKIRNVWDGLGNGNMITAWESKPYPLIEFWFNCKDDKYPASLLKPGCKIISQSNVERVSSMVCEN